MFEKYENFLENQIFSSNLGSNTFQSFQLIDGQILISLCSQEIKHNQLRENIQQFLNSMEELRTLCRTFQCYPLKSNRFKRKRFVNQFFLNN